MAAASYQPRILITKYEQTDNVKPLTTNRDLKVSIIQFPPPKLPINYQQTVRLSCLRCRVNVA